MFKRAIFLALVLLNISHGYTQSIANKPIAPFVITLTNGKTFKHTDLQKNKPAILIYFSPTCDHCKDFMEALLKQPKKITDKQFIMVTVDPLQEVKTFVNNYHIANYANIKVGVETSPFIVKEYYNVIHFPFVAAYNKQGKLVQLITKEMEPDEIIKKL